jgi:hypothetical protein
MTDGGRSTGFRALRKESASGIEFQLTRSQQMVSCIERESGLKRLQVDDVKDGPRSIASNRLKSKDGVF